MRELAITQLRSGGVMTNYYCSSACKHCLYGSSPQWEKHYMDGSMAERVVSKILSLGCRSIHIGGGEPFLHLDGLMCFLTVAKQHGLVIEYVETNSSWYKDGSRAVGILKELSQLGVDTLLLSMSPFHNEYVPFAKVKGLMQACRQTGVSVFPWIRDFYPDIDGLDDERTHSMAEYEDKYGENYLVEIAERFPLNFRGRALCTYKDLMTRRSLASTLAESTGCTELANTSHFHIDPYGSYIPGLCTGLAVSLEDLGQVLDEQHYPVIRTLYSQGIGALLEMAQSDFGFVPQEEYVSKCHLCFDIRRYFVQTKHVDSRELQPVAYYKWVDG